MSRAAALRLGTALATQVAVLAWFGFAGWTWYGVGGIVLLFAAGSLVTEAVYRRIADRDEQIADLSDRVRNPD